MTSSQSPLSTPTGGDGGRFKSHPAERRAMHEHMRQMMGSGGKIDGPHGI